MVFFGRLADLYGRKRIFLLGAVALAACSLGLAFGNGILNFSPWLCVRTDAIPDHLDEIVHDVLRGVQGAGDAAVIPAAVSLICFDCGRCV